MRIYLAGPLFTEEDKKINNFYASGYRAEGHEVYLPQEYKIPGAYEIDNLTWAKKVREHDIKMLEACHVVVAIVRGGKASDDGTAFEIGYAAARGKSILIYADEREPISLMFLGENVQIFERAKEFNRILKNDTLRYT